MRAAFSINVCVCFCTVILAMAPFFSQGQVPYQFDIIPEESPVHVEARLLYNGIEIGSEDVDTRLEGSFSSVYEPSTGTLSTVQVTNLRIEFEDDDIRIEEDRSIGGIGDVTVVIFLRSLEAHMVQEASVSMIGTGGSATIQNHEILLTGVLPWEYVIDPIFGSNIEDDGEETIEESITEEFTYTTSPTLNLVEGETVTARLSFRRNFDEDLGSGFEAEIDVDITAVGRAQVPAGGPSNDDLADAQVISGTMGQVSQSNADATKETGEPDHAGRPGGASLWYSWTAPASGVARFHTFGSDFDTVLGVYVGTGYGDFLEVASNDDLGTVTSALDLRVIQGEMYYVAVDGATATDTGQVHLNWSMLMGAASVWSNDFGLNDGWLAGRNPRFVEDVDGDGRADVVGIADSGVWVALSSGQDFGQPSQWAPGFGFDSGWSEDRHPRFVTDVNSDGKADVVGFANGGVVVATADTNTFETPGIWTPGFGFDAGWRVDLHPRMLADVTGDGLPDCVGFANRGVTVAVSTGSSFGTPALWIEGFGLDSGWQTSLHPRMLADVNGDGMADVAGFGNSGVAVALSNGSGFDQPEIWAPGYGLNAGWLTDRHPRYLADVNGDGQVDVAGFADAGVTVALSNGTSFMTPALWAMGFGYNSGWRVDRHPRNLVPMVGDQTADILAFGENATIVAYSLGDSFGTPFVWSTDFGAADTYSVTSNPRFAADVDGDGVKNIVGFDDDGVLVF